jgi:hypothetical protein
MAGVARSLHAAMARLYTHARLHRLQAAMMQHILRRAPRQGCNKLSLPVSKDCWAGLGGSSQPQPPSPLVWTGPSSGFFYAIQMRQTTSSPLLGLDPADCGIAMGSCKHQSRYERGEPRAQPPSLVLLQARQVRPIRHRCPCHRRLLPALSRPSWL